MIACPHREIQVVRTLVGDWRALGLPKGQPRPRAFVRNGRAAVYDSGTAEGWKGDVARACRDLENRCLVHALAVKLVFYMPRPKHHLRVNGQLKPASPVFLHQQKPDADNLAKAVLDALTGIYAWHDDDQVCELTVVKRWELPGEQAPGCAITITTLNESTL
jgi:Holliday junction resolvase RusA-like endonuclease